MKSFLYIVLTMMTSVYGFSQNEIIIEFTQTVSFVHEGNVDYTTVLAKGQIALTKTVNEKKAINLEEMKMDYFVDGVLNKTFSIQDCQNRGSLYILTLADVDLRNGIPFETIQVVDIKKNTSYYSWYYDGNDDASFLIQEKISNLDVN